MSIQIPHEKILAFCEKYHIRKFALFGSVLREDFRPDSAVDVLVEFESGHIPGWEFITMQDELSAVIGRRVDLNTPGFLSCHFRDKVLATARIIYERT